MRLNDKVAIITGGSRGIGKSIAQCFLEQGAKVVICGRDNKALNQTRIAFERLGLDTTNRLLTLQADVATDKDVTHLFETTLNTFGQLDILVNNAAILKTGTFEELSVDDIDNTYRVNIRGTIRCAQEAFQVMKKKKEGVIINISSLAGIRSMEKFSGFSIYTMSKSAVSGLTEALAVEGKPYGIRVNAIAPGSVNTQMLQEAGFNSTTEPSDISETVLFLADSKASPKISGSLLEILCND